MAQIQDSIRSHLPKVNVMQLAVAINDQPWVCTVHYYSDEDLNFYWISTLDRHHSKVISQNPKVAAAILGHENNPAENYVIGISVEGTAELIGEKVEEEIGKGYIEKLNKDPNLLSDILTGKNPHKFYRLRPSRIVLFDNKNFPEDPRQEWILNA